MQAEVALRARGGLRAAARISKADMTATGLLRSESPDGRAAADNRGTEHHGRVGLSWSRGLLRRRSRFVGTLTRECRP